MSEAVTVVVNPRSFQALAAVEVGDHGPPGLAVVRGVVQASWAALVVAIGQ